MRRFGAGYFFCWGANSDYVFGNRFGDRSGFGASVVLVLDSDGLGVGFGDPFQDYQKGTYEKRSNDVWRQLSDVGENCNKTG